MRTLRPLRILSKKKKVALEAIARDNDGVGGGFFYIWDWHWHWHWHWWWHCVAPVGAISHHPRGFPPPLCQRSDKAQVLRSNCIPGVRVNNRRISASGIVQ
jgi:hypothetical protein